MTVIVIAEMDGAQLKPATWSCVAAARAMAPQVHLLIAGEGVAVAAEQAARHGGVVQVLLADAPALADQLAETLAAQIVALAPAYSHIVFAATATGKNVAPRVAALLDVAQVSDVVAVIDPDTFERPMYAGNVLATVRSRDATKVLTVRPTAFEPAEAGAAAAPLVPVTPVAAFAGTRFVRRDVVRSDRPELATAKVVVSGGRALGSPEQFQAVLAPLADRLGAALGASRAAVDAGYAPNDLQVGQTGKVIAPDLYVACGISGAIQHLAGMKDAKVIVAVNHDPDAPIFGVADLGLVADLFDAAPALAAQL